MAMKLNFSNLIQLGAAISPLLLSFFLVMLSAFNSDIKGIVYLGGVMIASLINFVIMNTLNIRMPGLVPPNCNLVEFPFNLNSYISPAFNTMYITFTLIYLLMPMVYMSTVNYPVIISILCILVLDAVTKVLKGCTNFMGVLLGCMVGLVLGILWFIVFYATNNKELLFFNVDASNKVMCSRPDKQTFKCRVYKNGELVSTT